MIDIEDDTRRLSEAALTWFNGEYLLTIRHNERAYVARSDDGFDFAPLREWTFDDGEALGSCNNQQKWITYSDDLFLVYTRSGANNDHVFRHRAPLFVAEADPDGLTTRRDTERVVVTRTWRSFRESRRDERHEG